MKTLDRFLLKSYLGPMVLTFFIVSFIFMMNFLWRYVDELVGKGLEFSVVLELLSYSIATTIPMALPLATLLAAIMTMGNLGENNELLAMKSAGISLPRIMRPLFILVFFISVGSFFASNNLVPYAWEKMFAILYDVRNQRQTIEFTDGAFFNGIPDMSIRVDHQDPSTGLLTNVLIYDTSDRGGTMTTTIAESGYIRLSDDKEYLMVTLYNGERYQTRRNPNTWYDNSTLQHSTFATNDAVIATSGFSFERSDSELFGNSQTKNVSRLKRDIDSLQVVVNRTNMRSYEPLLKKNLLTHDPNSLGMLDSVKTDYSYKKPVELEPAAADMDIRRLRDLLSSALNAAQSSRTTLEYEEDRAKDSINQLYSDEVEWHRKVSLPFSVMIFFLIGAPLGAIIRKGGMGMPIVVSVIFFVFYYIVSILGEKMAKEGTWNAFSGMWLSSFILLPIAMYLIYKSTNDSNLFNMDWYRIQYSKLKDKIKSRKNGHKHELEKSA